MRDITRNSNYPRGYEIFRRVMSKWNYDYYYLDPLEDGLLIFHEKWMQFKQMLGFDNNKNRSGTFNHNHNILLDLIKNLLIQNEHKVVVELYPSSELAKKNKMVSTRSKPPYILCVY